MSLSLFTFLSFHWLEGIIISTLYQMFLPWVTLWLSTWIMFLLDSKNYHYWTWGYPHGMPQNLGKLFGNMEQLGIFGNHNKDLREFYKRTIKSKNKKHKVFMVHSTRAMSMIVAAVLPYATICVCIYILRVCEKIPKFIPGIFALQLWPYSAICICSD